MQRPLRCFFSFLLFLVSTGAVAQVRKDTVLKAVPDPSPPGVRDTSKKVVAVPVVYPKKDTVYKMVDIQGGLRLGVDLTRFAVRYFQPYRTDVTITADAQIKRNLYVASEVSYNRTSHSDTNYTYKGGGGSITLGVDYNLLKKREPGEKNIIYAGARYGLSIFNYDIPTYTVHDPYNGNYTGSYPKTNAVAHWIELSIGIRAEIFKNFYMGWSLRDRILLNSKLATQDFPPLVIPGYGKGNKRNAFDVQYTVSYFIPMYKVHTKVQEITDKKKK